MRILFSFAFLFLIARTIQAGQVSPSGFHISVIDGDGALNSLQGHDAHEPVIQVEDSNHKPVTGAYVEFDAPNNGPGAVFANGSSHFASTTNADGIATAPGLRNNGVTGSFIIQVHVSFEGQSIGEAAIHQTNISRKVANLSNKLQGESGNQASNVALAASVVGIALGDQFLINGAPTPNNANLLKGTRVQTLSTPVTLFLHDQCEFLMGPHSSATISPRLVEVQTGAVRARHFGSCKLGYGGLWVTTAQTTTADGVVAISGESMEVGSVRGQLQVVNTLGDVVGVVEPGSVSTFGTAAAASGASAGPVGKPTTNKVLLGTTAAAALAALGLAAAAFAQSGSSTSP
ncbi:MAG TPA: hypothetical protein VGL97_10435 [Bryobacteraceae bacterium]